jgi:hypothetical protein
LKAGFQAFQSCTIEIVHALDGVGLLLSLIPQLLVSEITDLQLQGRVDLAKQR